MTSQRKMLTQSITGGSAHGPLLYSDTPLSFWGGVDAETGEVIDRRHPLSGSTVTGQMLALPSGRGSCTGSSVLLQLILSGQGPRALLLAQTDEILVLGAVIAEQVFGVRLPIFVLGRDEFTRLQTFTWVRVSSDGELEASHRAPADAAMDVERPSMDTEPAAKDERRISLSVEDRSILDGGQGRARQVAMQVVLRMARLQGASELIDVSRAHIDGCIYTGSASLRFAEQLRDWGAKVKIPTTLNAISVDQRAWRAMGIDPGFGEPAAALAQAYVDMGAQPTFTCAPYQLEDPPAAGEHIVWAESNAVVFANSVLGAYTAKYADFLDICIALTGRAPKAGCHLSVNRRASMQIQVPAMRALDDAFYPLLGYWAGLLAADRIPVISGLESAAPSQDDLKAFGAAFATTSSAPMFHIVGVTPEAPSAAEALGGLPPEIEHDLTMQELASAWRTLNSAQEERVDLVALGNPHFSADECSVLAKLCAGRHRHPDTAIVVTTHRKVQQLAEQRGDVETLEAFGVKLVTDTCWCMLHEPVIPIKARVIMTNSGKYAHYAPGLTGREMRFGSLADCVAAASSGRAPQKLPAWLVEDAH